MKEIYDWEPWFRELARKIEEGGEAYLIEKAKQVTWGRNPSLLRHDDKGIDPFSFFYFLASKAGDKQPRKRVYNSVSSVFEIESMPPDTDIDDYYIFPTPPPVAALFHDGNTFNHELLWHLFRQAVKTDPKIRPDDFKNVLDIKNIKVAKLTQTLFLINPEYFLPADDTTFHLSEALGLPEWSKIKNEIMKDDGYEKYESLLKKLKEAFPGCRHYEINMFLDRQKSEKIKVSDNFFQVSTMVKGDNGADYWDNIDDNFKDNNWVYTNHPYPSRSKPKRGDIILVRTGTGKKGITSAVGRAIGIVYDNDYDKSGRVNENSRIHVLWINKSKRDLPIDKQTKRDGFSEVKSSHTTYLAFAETEGYKPSFDLINSLTGNLTKNKSDLDDQQSGADTMTHPLNQILYGPPGTGKTWNTVNRAVAIIEDKSLDEIEGEGREEVKQRFDKLKENGQIEMVTFHQNFTYEDFIEGIRPILAEDESKNIEYKLHKGIFREIAERADKNRTGQPGGPKYVLIIDEINRGNIAKIFGELITLIEPSKRIGGDDAATVTLPYSKDSKGVFGVPDNLYIIGTMNTADRSIALLDTALRRRFEFIEMMPDAKHHRISTDIEGVNCQELLATMNKRIHFLLDREHQIGHTYFMDVKRVTGKNSLEAAFKTKIIPLLQEYFYDNWEKIDLVLNKNGFIEEIDISEGLRGSLVDDNREVYELLSFNSTKWKDPKSYQDIYEKEQGETE